MRNIDISDKDPYRKLIGTNYITKSNFILYKIKLRSDPKCYNFTPDVSPGYGFEYGITPSAGGVGGPEFIYDAYVPPHTVIEVSRVTASRWLFIEYRYLWVKFKLKEKPDKIIEAEVLDTYEYGKKPREDVISLKSSDFEKVPIKP